MSSQAAFKIGNEKLCASLSKFKQGLHHLHEY
jgi:hypothetical protein